jgi:5-formyltetrahydrofolate cyclo-ligase
MQTTISKAQLRRAALKDRSLFSPQKLQIANNRITTKIISIIKTLKPRHINTYLSIHPEVDTSQIVTYCLDNQLSISAPRINGNHLALHEFTKTSDLTPGIWNIQQPKPELPQINPAKIDLFIVPGLLFDATGIRLGYGKGYYDRLLKNTPGIKVGIIYTNQLIYELPKSAHDIPVNKVVTDTISITI